MRRTLKARGEGFADGKAPVGVCVSRGGGSRSRVGLGGRLWGSRPGLPRAQVAEVSIALVWPCGLSLGLRFCGAGTATAPAWQGCLRAQGVRRGAQQSTQQGRCCSHCWWQRPLVIREGGASVGRSQLPIMKSLVAADRLGGTELSPQNATGRSSSRGDSASVSSSSADAGPACPSHTGQGEPLAWVPSGERRGSGHPWGPGAQAQAALAQRRLLSGRRVAPRPLPGLLPPAPETRRVTHV